MFISSVRCKKEQGADNAGHCLLGEDTRADLVTSPWPFLHKMPRDHILFSVAKVHDELSQICGCSC